jgi:glutamine synthetase
MKKIEGSEPPKDILEAAKIFKESKAVERILGSEIQDLLFVTAMKEYKDFNNHISNFEVARYLDLA